jgi:hypothetical protein
MAGDSSVGSDWLGKLLAIIVAFVGLLVALAVAIKLIIEAIVALIYAVLIGLGIFVFFLALSVGVLIIVSADQARRVLKLYEIRGESWSRGQIEAELHSLTEASAMLERRVSHPFFQYFTIRKLDLMSEKKAIARRLLQTAAGKGRYRTDEAPGPVLVENEGEAEGPRKRRMPSRRAGGSSDEYVNRFAERLQKEYGINAQYDLIRSQILRSRSEGELSELERERLKRNENLRAEALHKLDEEEG